MPQVGVKCAEDEHDTTRFDSSDIEFDGVLLEGVTLPTPLTTGNPCAIVFQ